MKRLFVVALSFVILSGCGNMLAQKEARLVPTRETKGKGELISFPGQLRTLTNKLTVGGYITCAEPAPDIALSDTLKLITGITSDTTAAITGNDGASTNAGNKISLNNDLQTTTAALELAGRTQTVLLAREFLYRTCEAASNKWLEPKDVKEAHEKILQQITGLIEIDKKKAETSAAIATAVAAGKLDPKLLGTAAAAVSGAIRDAAIKSFEDCLQKAGDNNKAKAACEAALNRDLN